MNKTSCGIILLAAGHGKRMRSSLPKVLHEVGGRPLLFHVLERIQAVAPTAPIAIVLGHQSQKVEAAIRNSNLFSDLKITYIQQPEQRGTGHAAKCVMESSWGKDRLSARQPVLVLPGDQPLLNDELVSQILEPLSRTSALRLLTCELPDPSGYGRVVRRGKKGPVLRIVEERDANLREKAICEVAASIYFFQSSFLSVGLQRLSNKNSQGEYYLTDLIGQAVRAKKPIEVLVWKNHDHLRGVNDSWELAQAQRLLNEQTVKKWAQKGVKFLDPWSTWIDVSVEIGEEVVISQNVVLSGKTEIGRGVKLGPHVVLKNMQVGEGSEVKAGTVAENSTIGSHALVGPYAHLRPDSSVGEGCKIGNFVELKKTHIGDHTSVAHLSYLGDAEVGSHVNIGCGFVTCNYDGRVIEGERKHRTIIEDGVFLGSDCQTVAPVKIGKGAYVASGSTITEDVEADSLAVARARQVNKPGYARKLRS